MKIIITGVPSSGKTTVGKRLAKNLKEPFYDLDELIVKEQGESIATIFATKGEKYFRKLEHEIFLKYHTINGILATGGGTLANEENTKLLKNVSTPIFLLEVNVETAYKRLKKDDLQKRPVISHLDKNELDLLNKKRQAIYAKYATTTINTSDLSPQAVVNKIKTYLKLKYN